MNKKADCLSRLPVKEECGSSSNGGDDDEKFLIASVRWSEDVAKSESVWKSALVEDAVLQKVMTYVVNGWPKERGLSILLQPFCKVLSELSGEGRLLFLGHLLVPPVGVE